LPTHPTIRPADICLKLIPGALKHPTSHLFIDVTIIPMSHDNMRVGDPLSVSVVRDTKRMRKTEEALQQQQIIE
jgi:hypothetical protein